MARAQVSQASNAASTAGTNAGTLFNEGQAVSSTLIPQLTRNLTAQHSYTPGQENELLTAAGAGTGGATGALESQAMLSGARTGNTSALPATLDAMQRQRGQQLAKASEGIAGQDVAGAQKLNQQAAGELGEMGNADTSAALKAMGIQTGDINAATDAGKSGWFQNMTGLLSSLGSDAQGAGSIMKALG